MKEKYSVTPTSYKTRVKLMDSSVNTGAGLTGLTFESAGLIISTIKDGEATPTVYSQAAGKIEDITTLGTFETPTATKCRFKEVDSTNHKGLYEIHITNARFTSAKKLVISFSGATNLAEQDIEIQIESITVTTMASTAVTNILAGLADGIALSTHFTRINAFIKGKLTRTGTATARRLQFKKEDGSTNAIDVTINESTKVRNQT